MTVVVSFCGEGSGEAELAWGQQDAWAAISRQRSWLPLGGIRRLPPATTVQDVAAELRYLLARYQVLRTKLLLDDARRPRQVVHTHGEIALEITDTRGGEPEAAAQDLCCRYRVAEMDFSCQWPVRFGVIHHRGVLTHLVAMISHLAVDAAGARVMLRELAARVDTPVTGMQPLEQVKWQQSAAGRRQNDASLRHIEAIMRKAEPSRRRAAVQTLQPPVWAAEFSSASLRLALSAIAQRTGAVADTIVLTLLAIAWADVTGENPVMVRPLVANRFRPGLAGVVCNVVQPGLVLLDVSGITFGEALKRVKRATLAAYKYAYYNPLDASALVGKLSAEYGGLIDIDSLYFNNRRADTRLASAAAQRDIVAALPRTAIRWMAASEQPMRRLGIRVEDDAADAMRLTAMLDTGFMNVADAEACLLAIERTAIESANRC